MSQQRAVERITPAAAIPAAATQTTAVEQARAVAEVAAAVQVAQQCPRDMNRAWAEMQAACARSGLAERAFYSVPNRGNGASVHLARELARIWGNVDYGVHELHRDDERGYSEIRAYAWDQQTNVRSSRTFQVPHARMANGQRKPLTDLSDVYLNNQNIGARAVREAIFTVLPADFVATAQDACRATIRKGGGKPLPERIANMISRFKDEFGISVGRIETRVGRKRGQWTAADLAELAVVYGSISRGESRADDEFPDVVTAAEIAAQAAAAPVPAPAAAPVEPEPSPGAVEWDDVETAQPGSGATR
ncbi:hypothetical protein [Micromonospora sp. WMMD1082]|uniref:hypothetical protein n=1 Tax=Micromonospora sp. WMMD1082 TaxID=3016104 RepID=UPI0024174FA5|nr:hypothetical protein [Micromonospora sp. WMMD1082]MDG4796183.1 hypothetical protein [Micromonospora sp. WMMD1082]